MVGQYDVIFIRILKSFYCFPLEKSCLRCANIQVMEDGHSITTMLILKKKKERTGKNS